ncbi:3-oxoacyl-[acyl-carrier protein] reductase [Phycicoccus badiiscoriae]|uniref:3-oxoacyl-[acyl-carrier protein] reductase n=1 Tax=Pedococcus badiiscoriae TaxID=642776 RepID=A0A852WLX9_9MICO|nr:3-oxoacyl-ACP reductase [Pedococcus badiiscoriae]NYG08601.1 3-oxoacyl-[acyl-carrier protein] reductase [Pedococcus badiiscoriae]
MAGTYAGLVNSAVGKKLATQLGLPRPTRLRRYAADEPLIDGAVLVGGLGAAPVATRVRALLAGEGIDIVDELVEGERVAAVVADLTEASEPTDLDTLRTLVAPALKALRPSGRVVVIGRDPGSANGFAQAATRRALEGITRSIGKELRAGATANLVLVRDGGEANVDATLRFLLSGRSAYVDGQVVRVGAGSPTEPADWSKPLAGKVAVVTGAARGIGASIAEVLGRDGATVVCVDIPGGGDSLARTANRVGGTALQLDVTAEDAGRRILDHATSRHGGLDIVVHNAGITRDKLLANMDPQRWASVLDVNLGSILRMNEVLLADGGVRDGGHVVLVSSIAGIAGNRGQTNYGASKAGVIGLVDAMSADPALRSRGITVNAVAPGFIETEMTAKVPFATREVGRLLNSLSQGGLPVDVAETIAWFSQDANAGVTGNVVRVCGQSLLGA